MRTIITASLCAALALPAAADDLTVLESCFVLHSTLYREDGARYESARRAEEEAVQRVAALNTALDRSLVDQSVPVSELRRDRGLVRTDELTGTWTARKLAPGDAPPALP